MMFVPVLLLEHIPVHPAHSSLQRVAETLRVFRAHLTFVYRSSEHLDLITKTSWHVSHLHLDEEDMPEALLHIQALALPSGQVDRSWHET